MPLAFPHITTVHYTLDTGIHFSFHSTLSRFTAMVVGLDHQVVKALHNVLELGFDHRDRGFFPRQILNHNE